MRHLRQMRNICRRRTARCNSTAAAVSVPHGWEAVVGLEVHAQILAHSKLFSAAGTEFAAPVNAQVHLVDAAFPGTLPVLNRRCVEAGVLTALALGMSVNQVSSFDRKHYFYADMPAGYQITQQRAPLAEGGQLEARGTAGNIAVRLARLQLEQDSGKSLHDPANNRSLIDLNRAGVALMELVFEPDLRGGEDAAALIKELILILRAVNTCSCKMEEGALRVDANVSVRRAGEDGLGVRSEVKNINSVRGVAKAVQFEVWRQVALLEAGGGVVNETRSYDPERGHTVPMRDKEVVQDYRFLPEPNLPPLRLSSLSNPRPGLPDVDILRSSLPELPQQTRNRLTAKYGLSPASTQALVMEEGMLDYFEKAMTALGDGPGLAEPLAVMLRMEVKALLNEHNGAFLDCRLTPAAAAAVFRLRHSDVISSSAVPLLLAATWETPQATPEELVRSRGWAQVSDETELEAACQRVLTKTPDRVTKYREASEKKKKRLFNGWAKEVRLAMGNRADMAQVSSILRQKLGD